MCARRRVGCDSCPAPCPGRFPTCPDSPGYNKRLRSALSLIKRLIRVLATDTDLWDDPVWIVDSTPVECARSRPTVKRSNLTDWAGYSYCPSHSRFSGGCACTCCAPRPGYPSPGPQRIPSSTSGRC